MRAFFTHILLNHEEGKKTFAKAIKFRYILPPQNSSTQCILSVLLFRKPNQCIWNFDPQSIPKHTQKANNLDSKRIQTTSE